MALNYYDGSSVISCESYPNISDLNAYGVDQNHRVNIYRSGSIEYVGISSDLSHEKASDLHAQIDGVIYVLLKTSKTLFDPTPDETKILAYNAVSEDRFGWAVSISDDGDSENDYIISGAPDRDYNSTNGNGVVYIYYRTGTNTWSTGVMLTSSDPSDARAEFGEAVAMAPTGDYAVVGGPSYRRLGISGFINVFHRTGTNTWSSPIEILAPNSGGDQNFEHFGTSVAISNHADYVVGGMPYRPFNDTDPGAAYIFHRTGTTTWDSGTKIQASDSEAGDKFGYSAAISRDSNYVIVGAPEKPMGGTEVGAAYIFHRTGTTTWDSGVRVEGYDASTSTSEVGYSVDISDSGDYAIVGARFEDPDGMAAAGSAYIFRRTGTNTWDSGTKIVAPDKKSGDQFGSSVSIFGDFVIVGAEEYYDNDLGFSPGAAYIFRRTGTNTWDSGTKIQASDKAGGDRFGCSVSMGSKYIVVGAYHENEAAFQAGAAYSYLYIL